VVLGPALHACQAPELSSGWLGDWRYKVKLLAIAVALESLPCAAAEQSNIAELRHMATHTNTAWTSESVIPEGKDYLSDLARMAPDEFSQHIYALYKQTLEELRKLMGITGCATASS